MASRASLAAICILLVHIAPSGSQYSRPTRGVHRVPAAGSPVPPRHPPPPPPAKQATGGGAKEGEEADGTADRQAFVTLVTTAKYVVGAEVLAKSLRAFRASRPLLALVDSSLPPHVTVRLRQAGWGIKYIAHVQNKNTRKLQDRPWFNTTFSKLHVFGLTEYEKIVYVDADVLLLANIDELFEKLPDVGFNVSRPFAASPEMFPPDTFNSGVLVIRPQERVYRWLLEQSLHVSSYDGSDQGFLNTVLSGWWQLDIGHRLDFQYNVHQTVAMYYPPLWENLLRSSRVSVLHFAGDDSMKPWSLSGVIPASLARYVHLWQEIARAPLDADVAPLYLAANAHLPLKARAFDSLSSAGEQEIDHVLDIFQASLKAAVESTSATH